MRNEILEENQLILNQFLKNIKPREEKRRKEKLMISSRGRAKSSLIIKELGNDRIKSITNYTNKEFFSMIKIACPPKRKKSKIIESDEEEEK